MAGGAWVGPDRRHLRPRPVCLRSLPAGDARGFRSFPIPAGSDRGGVLSRLLRRNHRLLVYTSRTGPRRMAVAAGTAAVVGMAVVAAAPAAWVLALGILVAGGSTGLASPPMAEAVARSIRNSLQDRANALINSGTSVGVALSGPAALLLAGEWRLAWAAFALVGLAVLAWNAAAMPREALADRDEGRRRRGGRWFGADAPVLLLSYGRPRAPAFGAALRGRPRPGLRQRRVLDLFARPRGAGGGSRPDGSTLFWTVIGVSGLAGGTAGDLVGRFGLTAVLRGSLVSMAGSMALLALAPGVLPLAYASAALFGSTYIVLTGVVLVWSVGVFREIPSAGLGTGFLLIAVGQAVGSPVAGALAVTTSPTTAFFSFAGVAVLTALVRPHPDLQQGLQVRE